MNWDLLLSDKEKYGIRIEEMVGKIVEEKDMDPRLLEILKKEHRLKQIYAINIAAAKQFFIRGYIVFLFKKAKIIKTNVIEIKNVYMTITACNKLPKMHKLNKK